MRLLHTKTLKLKQFVGDGVPEYAILSHTWGEEEVTFQEMENDTAKAKQGYSKLTSACAQAVIDSYSWIWIDTCCIDKSSSAELQEAINSMYRWYKNANMCYVYLIDVPDRSSETHTKDFCESRWFTRGWTLQELIAPHFVHFYARDWAFIGTKLGRVDEIEIITGVRKSILQDCDASVANVAERMSWAAHRATSREEDAAYSLMGIFDVNMPMLYGEGGRKAFKRLQQEISKAIDDHSLFLWWSDYSEFGSPGLLAPSVVRFCDEPRCGKCQRRLWNGLFHKTDRNEQIRLDHLNHFNYKALSSTGEWNYRQYLGIEESASAPPLFATTQGICMPLGIIEPKENDPDCDLLAVLNVFDFRSEYALALPLRRLYGGHFRRDTAHYHWISIYSPALKATLQSITIHEMPPPLSYHFVNPHLTLAVTPNPYIVLEYDDRPTFLSWKREHYPIFASSIDGKGRLRLVSHGIKSFFEFFVVLQMQALKTSDWNQPCHPPIGLKLRFTGVRFHTCRMVAGTDLNMIRATPTSRPAGDTYTDTISLPLDNGSSVDFTVTPMTAHGEDDEVGAERQPAYRLKIRYVKEGYLEAYDWNPRIFWNDKVSRVEHAEKDVVERDFKTGVTPPI